MGFSRTMSGTISHSVDFAKSSLLIECATANLKTARFIYESVDRFIITNNRVRAFTLLDASGAAKIISMVIDNDHQAYRSRFDLIQDLRVSKCNRIIWVSRTATMIDIRRGVAWILSLDREEAMRRALQSQTLVASR